MLFLMQVVDSSQFAKEYFNTTVVHPLGLGLLLVLSMLTLALPRHRAILPYFVMVCFISIAQRVVIQGLDFDFARILILVGWARVIWRGEFLRFQWKALDGVILLYLLHGFLVYTIERGSSGALVNRLGNSVDTVGAYFLFRILIRDRHDLQRIIVDISILSIPVAICFLIENTTGRNMFSIFGGVPEITHTRGGRTRSQGAFAHPIIAGCFWAVLLPFIASRWWQRMANRTLVLVGTISCLVIIRTCSSSTPVMALILGMLGTALFPFRHNLAIIRWNTALVFLLLHIGMYVTVGEPIWYGFKAVDYLGGTGDHRYRLYQAAVDRFDEWYLVGIRGTSHWEYGGEGGRVKKEDTTSMYVSEAVDGGLGRLLLFVWIIVLAFGGVGRMMRHWRGDFPSVVTAWALGIGILISCAAFSAVSYFGQARLLWFFQLATIASLTPRRRARGSGDSEF